MTDRLAGVGIGLPPDLTDYCCSTCSKPGRCYFNCSKPDLTWAPNRPNLPAWHKLNPELGPDCKANAESSTMASYEGSIGHDGQTANRNLTQNDPTTNCADASS